MGFETDECLLIAVEYWIWECGKAFLALKTHSICKITLLKKISGCYAGTLLNMNNLKQ